GGWGGLASGGAPATPSRGGGRRSARLLPFLLAAGGGGGWGMRGATRHDEPIAFTDADAVARLCGIADHFLTNDRAIHVRCDDSVTRFVAGQEVTMGPSRGHAPQPIAPPPQSPPPHPAPGGQRKAAFALGRGRHALLSHHVGDLDHAEAYRGYVEAISHYERLFALRPEWLVHDLHPDYASTRYALERGAAEGLRLLAVQHHHA